MTTMPNVKLNIRNVIIISAFVCLIADALSNRSRRRPPGDRRLTFVVVLSIPFGKSQFWTFRHADLLSGAIYLPQHSETKPSCIWQVQYVDNNGSMLSTPISRIEHVCYGNNHVQQRPMQAYSPMCKRSNC